MRNFASHLTLLISITGQNCKSVTSGSWEMKSDNIPNRIVARFKENQV